MYVYFMFHMCVYIYIYIYLHTYIHTYIHSNISQSISRHLIFVAYHPACRQTTLDAQVRKVSSLREKQLERRPPPEAPAVRKPFSKTSSRETDELAEFTVI